MLVQASVSSLRLEDSASQTMADAGLANYARKTARYISLLEAKVRALEAAERDMGNDSPLTRYLAEEVETYVAENDAPDMPDLQDEMWGPEECAEWDAWTREKAEKAWEDEDWDEDAQPPSKHLRRAAASMPAVPALPAPSRPAASAPVALDRINSSTHRREYMQLATCLYM